MKNEYNSYQENNMDIVVIIITIFVIVILWGIILALSYKKKSGLNKWKKDSYRKKIINLENASAEKRIINYDSLLSNILKDLWYTWTLWEQLKKKPICINNDLNEIWELHKLRNTLAHEVEEFDQRRLESKAKRYESVLKNLIDRA